MYMWSNGTERVIAASTGDLLAVLIEELGEVAGVEAWATGLGWRQMSPYERVTIVLPGGFSVNRGVGACLETMQRGLVNDWGTPVEAGVDAPQAAEVTIEAELPPEVAAIEVAA